eukprot:gene7709-7766_t
MRENRFQNLEDRFWPNGSLLSQTHFCTPNIRAASEVLMLRTINTDIATPVAARFPHFSALPDRAGIGLKPQHYADLLRMQPGIGFLEVHAENYMGAGGPPHHFLSRLREIYPLSLHGVGLSIGSEGPLDRAHLARLKALIARYQPQSFSEHLAWSTHDDAFLNDLLPVAYDSPTLSRVAAHIDQVQDTLGVKMLMENPSTYVEFANSSWDEVDFIAEIARRTGCGLLLDVNNVQVSCTNHGRDPLAYLDHFPMDAVEEIHLAGYAEAQDSLGARLLIDAHGTPVAADVWPLYARALGQGGAKPTLIEWDNDVPELDRGTDMSQTLFREALFDPTLPPPLDLVSFNGSDPEHRFAIYRNNVMVSLMDGLAAKFTTLRALVGETFFQAMARIYTVSHPPKSRLMADYGEDFPDFIEGFAPANCVPYLADMARLELARVSAYHAADGRACTAADFAALDHDILFDITVVPHPSAQILSSKFAIFSLWAAHQGALDIGNVDPEVPESVLICRPALDVEVTHLPVGVAEFLAALSNGQTIGEAVAMALAAQEHFNLGTAFQILVGTGVVSKLKTPDFITPDQA